MTESPPAIHTSSQNLFVMLCAIFVTALVLADIIGSKLFLLGPIPLPLHWIPFLGLRDTAVHPLVLSAGIIPFPLTFVLTDLINEFYGKKGARFVTFLGLGIAIFANIILYAARLLPVSANSPLTQPIFDNVFGLSSRMFLASLTAYLIGQLLDIQVFFLIRMMTKEKMLWLRSTGSTVVSQLIDSIIVTFIAFSGKLPAGQIGEIAINNYGVKFIVAVGLTPICYLGHHIIHRLLVGHQTASDATILDPMEPLDEPEPEAVV